MSPTTRLVYRAITAAIAWIAVVYIFRHGQPRIRYPIRLYVGTLAAIIAVYRTIVITEPFMPPSIGAWFRSGDIAALMWLLVSIGLAILPRTWPSKQ